MPVCLNHIDRQATSQCTACGKPLCPDCVLRRGRHVFCAPPCLDHYLHSSGNISRFLHHERESRHVRLRTVASVALAVCLLAFGIALLMLLR